MQFPGSGPRGPQEQVGIFSFSSCGEKTVLEIAGLWAF